MKKTEIVPPDQAFVNLFTDVQSKLIFPDSKTFVDCTAKYSENEILKNYVQLKDNPSFDLKEFVLDHFDLPVNYASGFHSDPSRNASQHIESLWPVLTRQSDQRQKGSSLIPLPYAYIVPGGRFGEIYYWDSYFTMLGLAVSGHVDLIENMIGNFAFLIDTLGFIPNGNRSYFTSRSQPPFFAMMVQLLAGLKNEDVLVKYLPQLIAEHSFWMAGTNQLWSSHSEKCRVVRLNNDAVLNRFWDAANIPRQESYIEDIELAQKSDRDPKKLFKNIRAACESGWDFSSRWFKDGASLETISCMEIVPVDLNCLMYSLEKTISKGLKVSGKLDEAINYNAKAEKRKDYIEKYFWDENKLVYQDYNWKEQKHTGIFSLAMAFPLFFEISDQEQAKSIATIIEQKFLAQGGLLTTLQKTGQQWDAPNGWPPLQWITVKGLDNYGYTILAIEIAKRWTMLCEKVYCETGKFVEKYNVEDIHLKAGGGEYPVQDGFGWSNGVYLKMKEYLKEKQQ